MAMILHELTTNAVKYGALSTADGYVEVKWSEVTDGRTTLRWTEANGPAINPPSRQGFGTRMMERMVSAQLRGEIRFEWRPQGLSCEITIAV
jgi:two-component sensor histidine kinase